MTIFLFTVTVFLTGFLLLAVQLVFGKITLPLLGGAPNVWLTSLAFYQTVLMFGYLYSYLMQRFISIKKQIPIHILLFLISIMFIPITLDPEMLNNLSTDHAYSLFLILLVSVGMPYFMLTATSPLTQSWFGNTSHKKSNSPYFLYVASNLGTFISLMIYPFIVEPYMDLNIQSETWSVLYLIEIALVLFCGVVVYKNVKQNKKIEEIKETLDEKIKYKTAIMWIFLAFIPSALLSSTITKLTIDIAPIPLLWVIPLGLYFLSFTIAFSEKMIKEETFTNSTLVMLFLCFILSFENFNTPLLVSAFLWILTLFFLSITFHKKLANTAPSKNKLTLFYLFLAIGGSMGGIFTGIICPIIFNNYLEHDLLLGIASLFILLTIYKGFYKNKNDKSKFKMLIPLIVLTILIKSLSVFFNEEYVYTERTFFGVYKIQESINKNGDKVNRLLHGSTLHGSQIQGSDENNKITLNYYSKNNGINQSIVSYRKENKINKVAVVGLGTGTMTCLFSKNEYIDYYEIDKEVANIAIDSGYFNYLSNCGAPYEIKLGDARIELKKATKKEYDLIVIDAFSSDAIPTHLLTLEAIKLYKEKIKNDGIIVFHISNRYLDLKPVIANIAFNIGMKAKSCTTNKKMLSENGSASVVVTIGYNLNNFEEKNCWNKLTDADIKGKMWTDQYSSLFTHLIY